MMRRNILSRLGFCFGVFILAYDPAVGAESGTAAESTEESSIGQVPDTCGDIVKQYCTNENTPGAKLKCLFKNFDRLTPECRQGMARLGRVYEQAQDQAQGSLISPAAMASQAPPFTILSFENRIVHGDNTMSDARVGASTPILQGKDQYLAVALTGTRIRFDRATQLPGGPVAPASLNRAEVGIQYTKQLPNYRNWGLKASIGHAGDKLGENSKDTTFSLIGNYGFPTQTGGFWMINVFMSNNSALGNYIPIPGVLYIYKTQGFTGLFGFPILSLQWTPAKDRSYSLSLLGIAFTAEAAIGEVLQQQYFSTFKWANQSFILSERTEDKDRLTLEEKRAAVGVRSFVFGHLIAEAEMGYSFDRLIYSGDGLRNMRGGSAGLDSNAYLSIALKAGF